MKLSRRNFLKSAGAALVAALVPKGKEAEGEQEQIIVLDEHKADVSDWAYIDGYCEGLNVWTEAINNVAEDGTITIEVDDDFVRRPDGSIDVVGTVKMRLDRASRPCKFWQDDDDRVYVDTGVGHKSPLIEASEFPEINVSIDAIGTIEEQEIGGEKHNMITSIDSVKGVNVEGGEFTTFEDVQASLDRYAAKAMEKIINETL